MLTKRLKKRYFRAREDFLNNVKEDFLSFDSRVSNHIEDVFSCLKLNRESCEYNVGEEEKKIENEKRKLALAAEIYTNNSEYFLLEDVYHMDGYDSDASRNDKAMRVRFDLLSAARDTMDNYKKQMSLIGDLERQLNDIEDERVERAYSRLDELGGNDTAFAVIDTTELLVLLQRATHFINQALLANRSFCFQLVSKARQTEILFQRNLLIRFSKLYNDQLDVVRDSFILWTTQMVTGAKLNDPPHRRFLLSEAASHNLRIKKEINQSLLGLSGLAQTLTRCCEGDKAFTVSIGGCEPQGWLRFYDEDYHNPLFSKPLMVVAQEWEVFIQMIVKNASVGNARLMEKFVLAEKELYDRATHLKNQLISQIEVIYTPTREEMEIIHQCSLSDEVTFPLVTIVKQDDKINWAREDVDMLLDPAIEKIRRVSSSFVQKLCQSVANLEDSINSRLILSENSNLVSVVTDSTKQLESISTKSLTKIRDFWRFQEKATLDFNDHISLLERNFANLSSSISVANTEIEASETYLNAINVLKDIEKLYHIYHSTCIMPMSPFLDKIIKILSDCKMELFKRLYVVDSSQITDDLPTLINFQGIDGNNYSITSIDWTLSETLPPKPQVSTENEVNEAPISVEVVKNLSKKGKKVKEIAPIPQNSIKPHDSDKNDNLTGSIEKNSLAEEQQVAPLVDAKEELQDYVISLISETFDPESIFPGEALKQFRLILQISLVQWMLILCKNLQNSTELYCNKRRTSIDEEVKECLNQQHYRPSQLQANVYEQRIKEIQKNKNFLNQHVFILENKINTIKASIDNILQEYKSNFAKDFALLKDFLTNISSVECKSSLDAHGRQFNDKLGKINHLLRKSQRSVEENLKSMVEAVKSDVNTYFFNLKNEFENNSASGQDIHLILGHETSLKELLENMEKDMSSEINKVFDYEFNSVRDIEDKYQTISQESREELKFIASIYEELSTLKGKFTNLIMLSDNKNKLLDNLICQLEEKVSNHSEDGKRSVVFNPTYCLDDLPAEYSQQLDQLLSLESFVNWAGPDELLSTKLRQTKVSAIAKFRESRVNQIVQTIFDLRVPLIEKGLVFDCLLHNVEFVRVMPDSFVDPGKAFVEAMLKIPLEILSYPKKATTKGKDHGDLVSSSLSSPTPSQLSDPSIPFTVTSEGIIEPQSEVVPSVRLIINEAADLASATHENIKKIIASYLTNGRVILRRNMLGGAGEEEIKAYCSNKINIQVQRIEENILSQRKVFREQVSKIFVALNYASVEIFKSLSKCTNESISSRLNDIMCTFNCFYRKLKSAQERNSFNLKGMLSVPSNKGLLDELIKKEKTRQIASQKLIKSMWAVSLREVQEEARMSSLRFSICLMNYLWLLKGILTPTHLRSGEDVVQGYHKGLRRLLRHLELDSKIQQLENINKENISATAQGNTKGASKQKETKQKPTLKGPTKHKGGKVAEPLPLEKEKEETKLTPLTDSQECMYPGISLSLVPVFDNFSAHSPQVVSTLVNHYVLPSQWKEELAVKAAPAPSSSPPVIAAETKRGKTVQKPIQQVIEQAKPQFRDSTPSFKASATKVNQTAFNSREQLNKNVCDNFKSIAAEAHEYFARLLLKENHWSSSWETAVRKLKPS